jgi:hypothetical protein
MNKTEEAFNLIWDELERAEKKFPGWPQDIVHGAAIIQEECGELVKACLDYYYGRGDIASVLKEAVQTGAMVYRFLFHIEDYKPEKGLSK